MIPKFIALLAAGLFLSACGSADSAAPTETAPSTTALTVKQTGELESRVDVTAGVGWDDGTQSVLDTQGSTLRVADKTMAVLTFPMPPVARSCETRASLKLWLDEASGVPTYDLAVYQSRLFGIEKTSVGASVPFDNLISNKPKAVAAVPSTPGWVSWDVTEHAHWWRTGTTIEGAADRPTGEDPLILAVRAEGFDGTVFEKRFTSREGAPEHRPRITWEQRGDCF